jgi:hypothetical protein
MDDAGIQLCGRWFYMREDPFRVRFPYYNFDGEMPMRTLSEVKKERELAPGVHRAYLVPDDRLCVYKEVDRPLYEPRDTDILEQELQNLKLVRGTKFIVQLVAAVVSSNPYRTAREDNDDDPIVLRGLLVEYYGFAATFLLGACNLLELSVRWYTVVYIPDVYIECLPRVS